MKVCYLDCFSGVSGDMLLGALVDAGLDPEALRTEFAKLGLEGVDLEFERTLRSSISGTNLTVRVAHDHSHRSLSKIEQIISTSELKESVKERAILIFRRLGEVEAAIHNVPVEKVHFHEVGAWDSIADIVGACIGFDLLGIEKIHCSALNLGSGTVKAAHGVMPVPAPATAALVAEVPTYSEGPAAELTTPTGAAIVTTLADGFGAMPAMRISATGYGAGDKDFPGRPNLLRVLIGEATSATESTEVYVIEANVDDMSPQVAGYVRERLLESGALDATFTPVFMKKDRPGFTISVLAKAEDRERLAEMVFAETTTLGLRMHRAERRVLERRWETVETPYGAVRIKIGSENGKVRNFAPEYEDCRQLAVDRKVPLKDVIQQANHAYLRLNENR
ncbi:MAG: nickel pincer cofactor biosynthesis protein LarC [Bryobacterales bacterium]